MRDGVWLLADGSAGRQAFERFAERSGWRSEQVYPHEGELGLLRYRSLQGDRIDAEIRPNASSPQMQTIAVKGTNARSIAAAIRAAIPTRPLDHLLGGDGPSARYEALRYVGYLAEPDDARVVALLRDHLRGEGAYEAVDAVGELGCEALLPDLVAVASRLPGLAPSALRVAEEVRRRPTPRPIRRRGPVHSAVAADARGAAAIDSEHGVIVARWTGEAAQRVVAQEQWTPLALALSDEHVWFVTADDPLAGVVSRVPRGGGAVEVVVRGVAWPGAIAFDREAQELIVPMMGGPPSGTGFGGWDPLPPGDGALLRIGARDGRSTTMAPSSPGPYSVACGGGTVAWITRAGELAACFRGGSPRVLGRARPTGVAVDAEGAVFAVLDEHQPDGLFRIDARGGRTLIEADGRGSYSFTDSLAVGARTIGWFSTFEDSYWDFRSPIVMPWNRGDESECWDDWRAHRVGLNATAITRSLAVEGDGGYLGQPPLEFVDSW